MGRLRALLRAQPENATRNATAQSAGLRVACPRECNAQLPSGDAFSFAPPGDPTNDAEAMAERAAIIAVENGWTESQALQETRWQADRERCWRAFLGNAQRVLDAPQANREALLARYHAEATARYGERTGTDMTQSLRNWIYARAVH